MRVMRLNNKIIKYELRALWRFEPTAQHNPGLLQVPGLTHIQGSESPTT